MGTKILFHYRSSLRKFPISRWRWSTRLFEFCFYFLQKKSVKFPLPENCISPTFTTTTITTTTTRHESYVRIAHILAWLCCIVIISFVTYWRCLRPWRLVLFAWHSEWTCPQCSSQLKQNKSRVSWNRTQYRLIYAWFRI